MSFLSRWRRTEKTHLDSVTPVDGEGTIITLPCNSELENSFGDLNYIKGSSVLRVFGKEL